MDEKYLEDAVYDLSDEERAQKEQSLGEEQILRDYKALLSTEEGRRVLSDILSSCGIFYVDQGVNEVAENIRKGRRQIGLNVLALCVAANKPVALELLGDVLE